MDQIQKIKIDDKIYDVNVIHENNKIIYRASDIGKILELGNIRSSIRYYNNELKIIQKNKTNGGVQNITYLTIDGIKTLISKSRSLNAQKLATIFEMNIIDIFTSSIESCTLISIYTCFKNENMIHQYFIDNYRIDLYFPDYKLAIECDELFHGNQTTEDITRQKFIENKLECVFIRYNPNKHDFNIFEIINKIYEHITLYKSL